MLLQLCIHCSTHQDAQQALLSTGSCSIYGICLTGVVSASSNTAPTISLVTTAAAPMTTSVKYGYSYTVCAAGQLPAVGTECELGATARDAQNGDLTAAVLVCAPSTCTSAACIAGKLFHLAFPVLLHSAIISWQVDSYKPIHT